MLRPFHITPSRAPEPKQGRNKKYFPPRPGSPADGAAPFPDAPPVPLDSGRSRGTTALHGGSGRGPADPATFELSRAVHRQRGDRFPQYAGKILV